MLSSAKYVGINSDQSCAQTLILSRDTADSSSNDEKIYLYSLVSCTCKDAFSRVRQAISEIQDQFFIDKNTTFNDLNPLMNHIKELLSDVQNLQIVFISSYKKLHSSRLLYILAEGSDFSAYLVRNNKKTNLLELGTGGLVSGYLKDGDLIWLFTNTLKEQIDSQFNLLKEKDPIQIIELFESTNFQDSTPKCAIFIKDENDFHDNINYKLNSVITVNNEESKDIPTKKNNVQVPLDRTDLAFKISSSQTTKKLFNKKILSICISIIIILIIVSYIYNRHPQIPFIDTNYYLTKAQKNYSLALSNQPNDTQKALFDLSQSKVLVTKFLKNNPTNHEALTLKSNIIKEEDKINKVNEVFNMPVWLNLSLIKSGFTASSLKFNNGKFLLLDTTQKILVEVDASNKSQNILAGPQQLGNARFAALDNGIAYVYSSDKGVLSVDTKSFKVTDVIPTDPSWKNISDLLGFGSNLYLLDDGSNQIWKYVSIQSGYAPKVGYINNIMSLAQGKEIQIDGSVWLLSSSGTLVKFNSGINQNISFQLDGVPVHPNAIYVSDQTKYVYLLDSNNNRLLVYDKNGNLVNQYKSNQIRNFKDLAVNEKNNLCYFLDGNKIYSMSLAN